MDRSLDDLIKENPKKFNLNRKRNLKRNNAGIKGTTKDVKKGVQAKKNQTNRVARVNGGRITKQATRAPGKQGNVTRGRMNSNVQVGRTGGKIVDARNTLLAKNRLKIVDARDKLADLSKKSDLRQKLSVKKQETMRKLPSLGRPKPSMGIHKLVRDVGPNPLTRTIISRTVSNDVAMHSYGAGIMSYAPQYELPPPPHFYSYQQESDSHYNFSSAAMDRELMPSVSKRIRSTDKRLGPREEMKAKSEPGFKIYVTNLHHKVTQEDIVELFGDVGPLMKAALQRPGMAEVIYVHREDALRAVDVYNNRQLDGLPMHCNIGSTFEGRRDNHSLSTKPRLPNSGKPTISPDINTIHKALFNKAPANSQIFTVTLPKKDA